MESTSNFKADVENASGQALDFIRSKRGISPATCLAALILFAFPFMNVTCNGQKVGSITGTNLVLGTTPNIDDGADIGGWGNLSANDDSSANIWAVLAFLAILSGALLFFFKGKEYMYEAFGIASAGIGLFGLNMLRWTWHLQMYAVYGENSEFIGVNFTSAYWLAVLLLHAAIAFSVYRLVKLPSKEQVPVHT